MERSRIREQAFKQSLIFPDSATLHPGYKQSKDTCLDFIYSTSPGQPVAGVIRK